MIWNQYDIILSFSCFLLCCFHPDNTVTFGVTSARILLPPEKQWMLCSCLLLPQGWITKISHLNICIFWFMLFLAEHGICRILCIKK